MNLYIRLLKTFLVSYWQGRARLADVLELHFRVWPNDLDFNLHMNNGRYLTLMDLGRMQFILRTGLMGFVVRERWMPMVGAAHFRFRRSLAPFQKFTLESRLLSWDEKWVYFEQRFVSRGELVGIGHVKGLIRDRNGNIPTQRLLELMGEPQAVPNGPVPHIFAERSGT